LSDEDVVGFEVGVNDPAWVNLMYDVNEVDRQDGYKPFVQLRASTLATVHQILSHATTKPVHYYCLFVTEY